MFDTRAEAQAKADAFNNKIVYVKAYAIEIPQFKFRFKYKAAFIPATYAEQYQNATLEMKYLFHFGMSSTFSTLLNNNDNNLYNNENIKALFDVEVTTQPELIDLKNYLGL